MHRRNSERMVDKLSGLSKKPGVYLFKDKKGDVIYIGKAKVLRNRVRSYFRKNRSNDLKQTRLLEKIADFETIITDSELEALILESNLVKQYKPRYNINLKDDKSFPYIRITNEPFPRIFPTRKVVRDGSRYFGPYTDVKSMRDLLKTIKRIFPIRSCNLQLDEKSIAKKKFTVCLDYHIHKCHGPCEGYVSEGEYGQYIDYVADFIEGKRNKVVTAIKNRMMEAAENLHYELAARLRDQVNTIEYIRQRQKVIDPSLLDRDIIAIASEDGESCSVIFKVREGKIIERQHFFIDGTEHETPESVTSAFVKQYYYRSEYVPKDILLPVHLGDEHETIREWLSQIRGEKVTLSAPVRGEKAQLIKMCSRNAKFLLEEHILLKSMAEGYIAGSLKALHEELHLPKLPMHIEAFDISNIQGKEPVASMVSFVNGKAHRSKYRRFRIRSKETPDDFAMMREAVARRYHKLQKEKQALPDLILIDGGKGQLSAALEALREAGVQDTPIIALAKRLDEVFVPGQSDAQNIRRNSSGLRLLQRIRDEAHRFAITYHRKLRKKRTLHSELEKIEGVGPTRRKLLIKHFGSMENVKAAGVQDLIGVKGIYKSLAEKIWLYLHPENKI